jgi:transcriptional regulator with XRE-family HTH domain
MNKLTVSFGRNLREARQEAGLTQAELADAAGINAGSVSDMETGRARSALPHFATIERLCKVLDRTPEELQEENLPERLIWVLQRNGLKTARMVRAL